MLLFTLPALKLTKLSTEQLCVAFAPPQCITSEQPKLNYPWAVCTGEDAKAALQ